MENTIQAIHRQFSFDILELVHDANMVNHLAAVKPDMVPVNVFTERAEYYRQRYPTYNFVTEKQIADICRKHGLVFGTLMNFSASIPIKNRIDISRFNLLPGDESFVDHELPHRIFRMLSSRGANVAIPSMRDLPTIMEIRSGYQPADMERPFDVIQLGEHFTLLRQPDDNTYRIFLEIDIHGSPWFIEFGRGRIDSGEIVFTWRQSDGGSRPVFNYDVSPLRVGTKPKPRPIRFQRIINYFAEVSLRMDLRTIQRANVLSLIDNVSPMVVADRSMFQRYGNATEIVGHRVKFKQSQDVLNTTFSFVDDPIILQPVPFGYLVVTKWGTDANIPIFTDPSQN